jgi:phosphate transport system substrate-binding protein
VLKLVSSFVAVGVMAMATTGALAQAPVIDSALPTYKAVEGVSGNVKSIGSDTLNNLMTGWVEAFNKAYPNVKIEVEGKGSATAPPALTEGQSQFGPMSREMKGSEIDAFEKKFGYKPTPVRVAIDCLAVFVHKDCPLESITMEQLKQIFSVEGKEMTWGDLGVKDAAWASQKVSLYGRNSASGTYGYFKEHALGKKDFKPTVKEQPGSSAVVQGIASDKFAMGYSGIGYKTADVKTLKVAKSAKDKSFAPSQENALSGEYPIARFLLIYVNAKPNTALDPLRAEFFKMVLSKQGQEVTVKDGYIPVPADVAREDLTKLGLKPGF